MRFTIKEKLLYFVSGIIVGYLLWCTTFIILLILLTSMALIHRKKISSFHSIIKRVIFPSLIDYKVSSMAIINGTRFSKKEKIKVMVSSDTVAKINEYCEWANIEDLGFFIEEAACFIFSKDKEWKDHQRTIKRSKKQETIAE